MGPNIIHTSTPRSPQWSLSIWFSHQDPIHPPLLNDTRHMPCPSQYLGVSGSILYILLNYVAVFFLKVLPVCSFTFKKFCLICELHFPQTVYILTISIIVNICTQQNKIRCNSWITIRDKYETPTCCDTGDSSSLSHL